CVLTIGC
ncbi:response regulator, partial [Vibrio parahaemolyticus V-223/04]